MVHGLCAAGRGQSFEEKLRGSHLLGRRTGGYLDCLRDLDRFGSRGGTYVCGACGPTRRRWWMDRGSGKKNVRVKNHKEDQMLQKMHRTGEK